jgi:hypothetical protein
MDKFKVLSQNFPRKTLRNLNQDSQFMVRIQVELKLNKCSQDEEEYFV